MYSSIAFIVLFLIVFMLFYRKNLKSIIYSICLSATTLFAQDLQDLYFGDDNSLDIATWNIEWFPKNDQVTVNYVTAVSYTHLTLPPKLLV